jgi:hypothetical protein
MLLMGRRLRTRLDLLFPESVPKRVEIGQDKVREYTASKGCRKLQVGDRVLARNYGRGEKWCSGVICEVLGSRHYIVDTGTATWKRHIDQIIKTSVADNSLPTTMDTYGHEHAVLPHFNSASLKDNVSCEPDIEPSAAAEEVLPQSSALPSVSREVELPSITVPPELPSATLSANSERRYPLRPDRQTPNYLKDYGTK